MLGPEAPRVAAVKKNLIWCTVENIEDFSWKLFCGHFPGNWRTKICEKFRRNFSPHFSLLSSRKNSQELRSGGLRAQENAEHADDQREKKKRTEKTHRQSGRRLGFVRDTVCPKKNCLINLPGGHLCNLIARFAEINSPESQACNSAGPCSGHRNCIFQKLIRIRGRSA